jgi:hypothetical protein
MITVTAGPSDDKTAATSRRVSCLASKKKILPPTSIIPQSKRKNWKQTTGNALAVQEDQRDTRANRHTARDHQWRIPCPVHIPSKISQPANPMPARTDGRNRLA